MKTKYLLLLSLLFTGFCATAQVSKDKIRENKSSKVDASSKVTNYEDYTGHYASAEDPDGIVIFVQENRLVGKIPQQPSVVFEHVGKHMFKSEKAGITITYSNDKKQLALQRKEGSVYLFKK
jgi:hypothetical protein